MKLFYFAKVMIVIKTGITMYSLYFQ